MTGRSTEAVVAAQGWYPSPNEVGYLRYWDGAAWTDHRQPTPVAVAPAPAPAEPLVPVAPTPVAVVAAPVSPISMDQFEKLYEQREAAEFAGAAPAVDLGQQQHVAAAQPGPAYQPAATPNPYPQSPSVAPDATALTTGTPLPAEDMSAAASADRLVQDLRSLASAPGVRALGEGLAAAGFLTNDQNGYNNGFNNNGGGPGFSFGAGAGFSFGGNRGGNGANGYNGTGPNYGSIQNGSSSRGFRSLNPIVTILIGIAVIVGGIFFALSVTNQSQVGPGEAIAHGIIDNVTEAPNGTDGNDCTPTASYAVNGHAYNTNADIGGSCNNPVGEDVTVIYPVADPSDGRLVIGGNGGAFLWCVPGVGLIFIGLGIAGLVRRRRAAQN